MPTTSFSSHGLILLTKDDPKIQALLESVEDAPEIHGDQIWCSSFFIMDYLQQNPPSPRTAMIEIGCGWGILSIFCAKQLKAKVIAVDADKYVFPFLTLQAEANQVSITTKTSRYEELNEQLLNQQDYVLGADICFWPELVDPLMSTIERSLLKAGKTILLADPGRAPFLKLAKQCQQKFNAQLKDVTSSQSSSDEGYLLIIKS